MKDIYYRARNISGQQITLDIIDKDLQRKQIIIAEDETLDYLNEHTMKFLWRYVECGLISVDTEWGITGKPDWQKEGF